MPPALPIDWHTLWATWTGGPFAVAVAVVLLAVAVAYLRDVRQLAGRGRSWPVRRTAPFLCGLVAVELALGSAVPRLSMQSFTAHIVQHLLLMVVAPPLLALGAPMTLLLQTARRPTKTVILRVLHSLPFAVLTHPVLVWFAYYGAMFAFFLSPLLGTAMAHPALMDGWNVLFFGGATLFWWPMVGIDPIPRWRMSYGLRFLNLLIGVPFESFLGIALMTEHSSNAPMYTVAGIHTGGGVLWAMTELFTLAAMVPMFTQWSRADLREGRRLDARLDAELGVVPVAAAATPTDGTTPVGPDVAAPGGADPAGPVPARRRTGMAASLASIRRG